MKNKLTLLLLIPTFALAQGGLLDQIKKDVKKAVPTDLNILNGTTGNVDIAAGLKEALNKGIEKQVSKLTTTDGFYKNEMVKILLPEEIQKVDEALRKVGLSSLANKGLLMLNRAAEDAVKESTPIFVDAVKKMSFADAKNILMGNESAATNYLQTNTISTLYAKFNPVIKNSFTKVGADEVWETIIKKYNSLPMVKKLNPDLTDYTTNKALEGVFKMIAVEEKKIRSDIKARTSPLLQQVFAMQDKK
ncbi:MAG: DUF4197 domain-containing protein [Flavobacteriaceae bacterium]|nr:DUF4197 domain-containing protein [Flavobacteriaceae bacterium]